jgi:hypothetical protein
VEIVTESRQSRISVFYEVCLDRLAIRGSHAIALATGVGDPKNVVPVWPFVDPLGMTGFRATRYAGRAGLSLTQYPVLKVQAQRSDTIRMVSPAVNNFFQCPQETSVAIPVELLQGMRNAPVHRRRREGVHRLLLAVSGLSGCLPRPDASYQDRAPLLVALARSCKGQITTASERAQDIRAPLLSSIYPGESVS